MLEVKLSASKDSAMSDIKAQSLHKPVPLAELLESIERFLPLESRSSLRLAKCSDLKYYALRIIIGGLVGAIMSFMISFGGFLKGVLDSTDLNDVCVAFLDGSTMLTSGNVQLFWYRGRLELKKLLRNLSTLTVECCTSESDFLEMQQTSRQIRMVVGVVLIGTSVTSSIMGVAPLFTGQLTSKIWMEPSEPYLFWVLNFWETICFINAGTCVFTVISLLMTLSVVAGCLARVISGRLTSARKEEEVKKAIILHQKLMIQTTAMANHFSSILFAFIAAFLGIGLLGTYNMVSGKYNPYVMTITPAAMVFFCFLAVIGDTMVLASDRVAEAAWECGWEEDTPEVRRMLVMLMIRTRRPATLRMRVLGYLTLPVYMTTMRTWYSYLQMMIKMV